MSKKMIFLSIVIMSFSFIACEGPTGSTGPTGPAGALEVWDNSSPPQRLGVFIAENRVLTPNGYVVAVDFITGFLVNSIIIFTQQNQSGHPMVHPGVLGSFPNRVIFNPHSNGTWYTLAENSLSNPVSVHAGANLSFFIANGSPASGYFEGNPQASGDIFQLRETSRAEVGFPEGVLGPLVLRAVQ